MRHRNLRRTSEEKETTHIPIEAGTEISVDLDGDGKEDIVRVVDNGDIDGLAKDGTRLIANVNGVDTAIKDYEGYVYGSRITTGDLSGDGIGDFNLIRLGHTVPVLISRPKNVRQNNPQHKHCCHNRKYYFLLFDHLFVSPPIIFYFLLSQYFLP